MVGGLVTGYRFVSFRVGKWMLAWTAGRLRLRRFSIAGTGGQCLMSPPETEDFCYPVSLYNLGGCLMNAAAALLCALLLPCADSAFAASFLTTAAIFGAAFAVLNGVPMEMGGLANDGRNLLALRRDAGARRALWLQLAVNARMTDGDRLGDMPEQWFALPAGADLKNPLLCAVEVFAINRLHDLHRFDEARIRSERLMERVPGMLELHKNELRCELLFYALLDGRAADFERLYTPALKKYIRATRAYPARVRLRYACALLHDGDTGRAAQLRQEFEKAARAYPFDGEVRAERRLLELVDAAAAAR